MNPDIRDVLNTGAVLGATALFGGGLAQGAFAQAARGYLDPAARGKPGDFDFLQGDWKIAH